MALNIKEDEKTRFVIILAVLRKVLLWLI